MMASAKHQRATPRQRIMYWLCILKPGEAIEFDLSTLGMTRKNAVNYIHQLNAIQVSEGVKTHYRTLRIGRELLGVVRKQ